MVFNNCYNPNIPHLEVGYNPFTNQLLTSWDIQVLVVISKFLQITKSIGNPTRIFC